MSTTARDPASYIVPNAALGGAGAADRRPVRRSAPARGVGYRRPRPRRSIVGSLEAWASRVDAALAGRRRRPPLALRAGGRHQGRRLELPADGHRHDHRARAPARRRAVQHFLPGGPFAILPLTGNRSLHHLDRGRRTGRAHPRRSTTAGFLAEVDLRFGGRLGALALAGRRLTWPLEHASGPPLRGAAAGSGRRCRARRASDRRPGAQSGAARCGGAGRMRGRGRCGPASTRRRDWPGALRALAAVRCGSRRRRSMASTGCSRAM